MQADPTIVKNDRGHTTKQSKKRQRRHPRRLGCGQGNYDKGAPHKIAGAVKGCKLGVGLPVGRANVPTTSSPPQFLPSGSLLQLPSPLPRVLRVLNRLFFLETRTGHAVRLLCPFVLLARFPLLRMASPLLQRTVQGARCTLHQHPRPPLPLPDITSCLPQVLSYTRTTGMQALLVVFPGPLTGVPSYPDQWIGQ